TILCELYYLLTLENSRFRVTVESLSGLSVRRALELVRSMFNHELSIRAIDLHSVIVKNLEFQSSLDLMNTVNDLSFETVVKHFYKSFDDFSESKITKDIFFTDFLYKSSALVIEAPFIENLC